MIRLKDGEPRECTGKYIINQTNLGMQIIVANQIGLNKADFINDFVSKVKEFLNNTIEEK